MQQWFTDAKLGIFIHYGIYAVQGVAESWSFYNGKMSREEYMKQLDSFALFDTQYSDLSVMKATPAKRDIVKEWSNAIRERGLHVGMYYSLIDWSHPDYPSVFESGIVPADLSQVNRFSSPVDGIQDEETWQKFLTFNNNQLREIMTNYGTVDLLWFDGDWERSAEQWGLPAFKEYLRSLSP
ncbi:alpha-L-fucosidase, partial [Paenibacillus sp.]|uniref:alpha-L-fucosidase n=1 Tax=Paenibacillus sp. TaxID=58172 RepID=UPI0028AB4800